MKCAPAPNSGVAAFTIPNKDAQGLKKNGHYPGFRACQLGLMQTLLCSIGTLFGEVSDEPKSAW